MKQSLTKTCASLIITSLLLTGCIKKGDNLQDPYEPMNRKLFTLSKTVDEAVLTRPAKMYRFLVPAPARKCILQFFSNLYEFPSAVNFVLQKRPKRAINSGLRFVINSTLGMGGILEVANSFGHEKDQTDFGITLAVWGNKNSPYFFSPFSGPSTFRDTLGIAVDTTFIAPYYLFIPNDVYYGLWVLNLLSLRANMLDNQEALTDLSFDEYVMIRDAYLQRRNFLITGETQDQSVEQLIDAELGKEKSVKPAAGIVKVH